MSVQDSFSVENEERAGGREEKERMKYDDDFEAGCLS